MASGAAQYSAAQVLKPSFSRLGLPGVNLVSASGSPARVEPFAGERGAQTPAVLDLRGAHGTESAPESLAATIARSGPLVVLIDEKTYGDAEILAERLRELEAARLVGRPTAGAAVRTREHPLATGGALVLPLSVRVSGSPGSEGVVPDVYVPPGADRAAELWLAATLRAAGGRGR